MATKEFDITNDDLIDSDDNVAIIDSKGIVKLRKTNDKYSNCAINGTYESGTFTVGPLDGEGIGAYLGFFHRSNDTGKIRYRISVDKGNTWLFYNENLGIWEEATTSNHWSTEAELDGHLEKADAGVGRSLRLKIKLIPEQDHRSLKVGSPVITNISLYYEIIYSFMTDVKRSIKDYFDANFRPRFRDKLEVNTPRPFISYKDAYDDINVEIKPPIKAFNKDNDPSKTTNIFDKVVDNKIFFESDQEGVLELLYNVKLPTYVNPADEQLNEASIPSVIVNFPLIEEEDSYMFITEDGLVEISPSQGYARMRNKGPLIYRITVQVTVQADRDLQALPMADELRHEFNSANPSTISSKAGGFDYEIIRHVDTVTPDVLEDSRLVYQSEFEMLGFDYGNEEVFDNIKMGEANIDVPLVENIEVCVSSGGRSEIVRS